MTIYLDPQPVVIVGGPYRGSIGYLVSDLGNAFMVRIFLPDDTTQMVEVKDRYMEYINKLIAHR